MIRQFTRLPRPAPPEAVNELTARELEIFRLISDGLSNAEISDQLVIGDTTVKTHVTHILQKLGLRDPVQAVVLAYQTGFFEPGGSRIGRWSRQQSASGPARGRAFTGLSGGR